MSIVEIPIEAEENKEILEEKEEREENLEKGCPEKKPQGYSENGEQTQKIEENEEDDEPPRKRPRGRPKGTAKPKEEKPQKPQKEPKEPKKKEVVKPKISKKRAVKFESSSEDELPEYVRREGGPAVERDLSMQMLRLLQNHESIKASNRRRLYASWFAHH